MHRTASLGKTGRWPAAAARWVASTILCACAAAADWPLYRGPAGDGVTTERIRTNWNAHPPQLLWRTPLTNGLSSVTVSAGRVFTQVRTGGTLDGAEHCVALDARTGQILWTAPVDLARYPDGGVGADDGPRSTPVVRDGRVYVLGSYLKLHCLDAATGAPVWSRDLRADFGGNVIAWQNAASPLIEGNLLFVNLNAGTQRLAAFRLSDGSLVWRRHNDAMTHATPIAATLAGVRQVIFLTQTGLVAVNPADGALLWRFAPLPYSTSIAANPVVESNVVFYSGAYSMGAAAARITASGGNLSAQTLMGRRSSRMIHWSTPVAVGRYLYGLFGQTSGQLRCLDLQNNGDYTWQGPEFGPGALLLVDGKILVAAADGQIVLVEPDPAQYREITRFRATDGRIWNSPALSDGVLYVRATTELAAFHVAPPLPPPLRLSARWDPATARLVFTAAHPDGLPVDPARAPRLSLRASTDLAQPRAAWTPVPVTWAPVGGVLQAELTPTPDVPARFFCVAEMP
jgi:outer membrane protein assembly factor BamB